MSKGSRRKKQRPLTSVNAAVERLQAAVKAMNASRSRHAANDFLAEVYSVYWEWLYQGEEDRQIAHLNRRLGLHRQTNKQPFKTLIVAANCSLEAKQRSRWVRALEYASLKETRPEHLTHLLERQGGIAGCARLAAKYEPKRATPTEHDSWADDDCT